MFISANTQTHTDMVVVVVVVMWHIVSCFLEPREFQNSNTHVKAFLQSRSVVFGLCTKIALGTDKPWVVRRPPILELFVIVSRRKVNQIYFMRYFHGHSIIYYTFEVELNCNLFVCFTVHYNMFVTMESNV